MHLPFLNLLSSTHRFSYARKLVAFPRQRQRRWHEPAAVDFRQLEQFALSVFAITLDGCSSHRFAALEMFRSNSSKVVLRMMLTPRMRPGEVTGVAACGDQTRVMVTYNKLRRQVNLVLSIRIGIVFLW